MEKANELKVVFEQSGFGKRGVYFVRNNQNNLVKIGCSTNIPNRIKSLDGCLKLMGDVQTELELIDYILCRDHIKLESDIHNELKDKQVVNEWFNITENDIELIKNKFDIIKYNYEKEQSDKKEEEYTKNLVKAFNNTLITTKIKDGKLFISTNVLNVVNKDMYNYKSLENFIPSSYGSLYKDKNKQIYSTLSGLIRHLDLYLIEDLFTKKGLLETFYIPLLRECSKYYSKEDIAYELWCLDIATGYDKDNVLTNDRKSYCLGKYYF